MSQRDLIAKTPSPITKATLVDGFTKLGLKKDDKIEVHGSISSFGYIVNQGYDIIDALMTIITEGVILMPAHTSEQSDPADWENPPVPESWIDIIKKHRKPFDTRIFLPERIGRLPIIFLQYPDIKRTLHPSMSLAVYNRTDDPDWLIHDLDDTKEISPLSKLRSEKGKILFLGTDFDTCTSIHLSEHRSAYSKKKIEEHRVVTGNETIETVKTIIHEFDDTLIDPFTAIKAIYKKKYLGTDYFKQQQIGLSICTLIDAEKLYDVSYDFFVYYTKPTR